MYRRSLPAVVSLALLGTVLSACQPAQQESAAIEPAPRPSADLEVATFAGGCFWCMEPPYEGRPGIVSVVSGYSGGSEKSPTYEEVSSGTTGHAEAIQVTFDPAVISYEQVLDIYWRSIDPTDAGGQFADRGTQYRPAIFVRDERQRAVAERSKKALAESGRFEKPIAVAIVGFDSFWPAEDYHQDYFEKEPSRYKRYRKGSGRTDFLLRTWGEEPIPAHTHEKESEPTIRPTSRPSDGSQDKPNEAQLRDRLSEMQFQVTQQCGTEPPFRNEFWDNKRKGLYVDVVSGEPLFLSSDKFESGSGWPSFVRPAIEGNIVRVPDNTLWPPRVEVRSKKGNSHLGHVFDDGPAPTGQRYCINSASLRFIPFEDLEKEGYGEFVEKLK